MALVLSVAAAMSYAVPDRTNATSHTSSYDAARALKFAQFSNVAYCPLDKISDWSCNRCAAADPFFTAKTFSSSKSGMDAFVGTGSNGDIIVSFRGSSNLANWIENLQFSKRSVYPKCDGCEVHDGFYKAWLSVSEGILAEVTRLHAAQPSAKIYVTGHSLGAALAALCAADLGASSHSLGFPIAGVFTFGQPRVGNAAFASFYEQGTRVSWRVTHYRDPVPHLPLEGMGFRHIGTEVFYSSDNSKYTLCDGSGEDAKCSDQFDIDSSVWDHLHYFDPPIDGISDC